uniref:Uncharacterized protein n=1 Tax=Triticum urartu TaxID=4572 RepID=A0A8R7P6L9_TRIUA
MSSLGDTPPFLLSTEMLQCSAPHDLAELVLCKLEGSGAVWRSRICRWARSLQPSFWAGTRAIRGKMPRRGKLVDDSEWSEVEFANSYALLIGYLSMAVKGLGFLVLTWTTVVLLGGYVSILQKKDFWCLTFITLVQTAGIFDVLLTEKLSYIMDSVLALLYVRVAVVGHNELQSKRQVLADVMAIVQLLVFVILLCPLAAVYMFGLLISAGISVWRLRQHDYGSDADGLGNLKPALDVLYSIALLQGVIF